MAQAVSAGRLNPAGIPGAGHAHGADVPLGGTVPDRPVPGDGRARRGSSSRCAGWPGRGLRGASVRDLLAARAVGRRQGPGRADLRRWLRRFRRSTRCRCCSASASRATVFVIAGRLGGDNGWDPDGPRKPLMDAGARSGRLAEARHRDRLARAAACPAARGTRTRWPTEIGGSRASCRTITGQPVPAGSATPTAHRRRGGSRGPGDGLRLRLRDLAVGAHRAARAAAHLHR